MKKYLLKYLKFYLLFSLSITFFSCSDDDKNSQDTVTIKMINPTTVDIGTEINIIGYNLDKINKVIFPGNIEVTDFVLVGNSQINVKTPPGISNGNITLKTAAGRETVSHTTLKLAQPEILSFSPSEVAESQVLFIRGNDLGSIKTITFPDNIVVEALDFVRKSDDEIRIKIPKGVEEGLADINLMTANNKVLTLSGIYLIASFVEPEPIMINDFEQHGDHNGGWDGSWDGFSKCFNEDGNAFIKTTEQFEWNWIFNCNHQNNSGILTIIEDVEKYVIRLDVKIESGVVGAEKAALRFILADSWDYHHEPGLLPATTSGEWVTVEVPVSYWNMSGKLDLTKGTNGLYGGPLPAGVCFDNFRFQQVVE